MIKEIEIKIIRLIADGLTQKEIAAVLERPETTIETYRFRLFRKIKVKNAPQCISWAYKNKVLIVNS